MRGNNYVLGKFAKPALSFKNRHLTVEFLYMFGLYYLIRDLVVSLAALGGAFLWMISPDVNLLAAFGFGVAGTIWFAVFGRDVSPPGSR